VWSASSSDEPLRAALNASFIRRRPNLFFEHIMVRSRCQEAEMGKYRLRDASEYTDNIVNTVREPLVVLDDKFRVISANRSFYSTFKVTPEMSENTPLFDLGDGQWNIPKLRELLEEVLPEKTSIEDFEVEHDFPAIGKKTMLLNARRIRSKTGTTEILLAIEDITERKRLEDELRDASEYAQNIVNTVREPLVVLDDKFRVVSTNRSFSSTFKVTPEMSENTMLFDLGNGQWNIPKLRELLEEVLPEKTSIEDFEVEHDFPAIGRKTMLLNARRIRSKTGATQILLAIEDITERKRAGEELQRINMELEEVLERETNVSQSLQAVFYPRIRQTQGYQFAARYKSVLEESELGGDNYDVFSLGGDETALAIADVSGKGLQAAILGAFVKSVIRAYLREGSLVSETATRISSAVYREHGPDMFVTAFIAILDRPSGTVRYVNAGHPGPLHVSAERSVEVLRTASMPLGILPEQEFIEGEVVLAPGDYLVLYTDGLYEIKGWDDASPGAVAGEVRKLLPADSDSLAEKLVAGAKNRAGGKLDDDVAVLVLRRNPA
jgi:PAS domain S-box-containing protein